jgi:hypothetical protein
VVDITQGQALLAALQAQFNAARQGTGQGTSSTIPGLPGSGGDDGGVGGVNALAGISPGGVPGTATTGQSIVNSLIGGAPLGGDPLAQQVFNSPNFATLFGGGGGSGEDVAGNQADLAQITGGNADVAMAALTGNPLLMAAALGLGISGQGDRPGDPVFGGGGTNFEFSQPQGSANAIPLESLDTLGGSFPSPSLASLGGRTGGGISGGGNAAQFDTPEFGV